MDQTIEFAKLSGSGNDFICIDNRNGQFDAVLAAPDRVAQFARTLCARGIAVGADGVIFGCDHEVGDFADLAARFFEADGTEAELCGNGTACFVRWVLDNRWFAHEEIRILTGAGVVRGTRADADYIKVCIPFPEEVAVDNRLEHCGAAWRYDYAVTGVPHAVTFVADIEEVEVTKVGRSFRRHERFAPRGVNANFVEVLGEGRIAVRTFEFGVEAETMACGTGSATAALFAAKRFHWSKDFLRGEKPILVQARSGDVLRIWVTLDKRGEVTDLCLETVVRSVFHGRLDDELAERVMPQPLQA